MLQDDTVEALRRSIAQMSDSVDEEWENLTTMGLIE